MTSGSRLPLRIAYLYSDLPSYVRARKTLETLTELVEEVHFIGCRRTTAWDETRTPGVEYHMEDRVLGSGFRSIPGLLHYFRYILKTLRKINPDVLIIVNEELALPFAMKWVRRPRTLIVDLYDSIAMRVVGRGWLLQPLWNWISRSTLARVDALVEVDPSRLALHKTLPRHTAIIFNSPRFQSTDPPPAGLPETFIYAGGTLDDGLHGVEALTAVLDLVPELQVVVTGKPLGNFVRNSFLRHPRVHFLGVLPYPQVLGIMAASRGVYSHYNPKRLNYIYGAPNKLYEAMMVCRPVLINHENRASKIVEELGNGAVSAYEDVTALADDLKRMIHQPETFDAGTRQAREIFRETYAWEKMAHERWGELLRLSRGNGNA